MKSNKKILKVKIVSYVMFACFIITSLLLVVSNNKNNNLTKESLNSFFADPSVVPGVSTINSDSTTIEFNDENLYKEIKENLEGRKFSITSDDANKTITVKNEDIDKVTGFTMNTKGIIDLTGIEAFKNIDMLRMGNVSFVTDKTNWNKIESIEPLRSLTKLNEIRMSCNNIESIDALSNCTELTVVELMENKITSIEAFKNCKKLHTIEMRKNEITDIEPLRNCTNLVRLELSYNHISDIEPIRSYINNVQYCFFNYNTIEDTVSTKTYKLPSIITESKNKDTEFKKFYTEKPLELTNCTISDDNTVITLNDDIKPGDKIIVKIPNNAGAAGGTTLTLTPTEEYFKPQSTTGDTESSDTEDSSSNEGTIDKVTDDTTNNDNTIDTSTQNNQVNVNTSDTTIYTVLLLTTLVLLLNIVARTKKSKVN